MYTSKNIGFSIKQKTKAKSKCTKRVTDRTL